MNEFNQSEYDCRREVEQRALAERSTRDDTREFQNTLADRYAGLQRQQATA